MYVVVQWVRFVGEGMLVRVGEANQIAWGWNYFADFEFLNCRRLGDPIPFNWQLCKC